MLLPRPGIIYHQRPNGQELVARSLSLCSIITLQNDILFQAIWRGGGAILFHIFCTGICTPKYLGTTEYQSYLFSVQNSEETCKILYSRKYLLILVLIDT